MGRGNGLLPGRGNRPCVTTRSDTHGRCHGVLPFKKEHVMTLIELALHFGLLSLISIGGMLSVIPEMHRYVVEVKHWITPPDFVQLFAVGQAAPGPNLLIAGLIGWKVSGIAGALVA